MGAAKIASACAARNCDLLKTWATCHRHFVYKRSSKIDRLVYYRERRYVGETMDMETALSGCLRAKEMALIQREKPTWDDLADDWGKACAKAEFFRR